MIYGTGTYWSGGSINTFTTHMPGTATTAGTAHYMNVGAQGYQYEVFEPPHLHDTPKLPEGWLETLPLSGAAAVALVVGGKRTFRVLK